MWKKLRSKNGEVMIIIMAGMVAFMCGLSYLKQHQKNKTIDTIENPAPEKPLPEPKGAVLFST